LGRGLSAKLKFVARLRIFPAPMIRLRRVQKSYPVGERRVVACEVEQLEVADGEQVALIGRSGSGKTTLLHMLAGILRPDTGEVEVAGARLDRLGESARDRHRGRHIGMVYQTFNLLQPFSALENVLLGALFGRGAGAAARARAESLLVQVGLGDRLHHRPNELSVGQVQRVAICRALVNDPELVLMDEPLGNQDRATGEQVLDMLLQMAARDGKTVVMVTHDPASAARMQRTVDLATLRRTA
jgi:ABC-type lipoprotein export system ATPase subunit